MTSNKIATADKKGQANNMSVALVKLIVFAFAAFVLIFPVIWMTLLYNVHMFQQNGYKNKEHRTWIKKHFKRQWILVFSMFIALIQTLFVSANNYLVQHSSFEIIYMVVNIVIVLTYLVTLADYIQLRKMFNKKPLVFTARVKRLIVCDIIICCILFVLFWFVGSFHLVLSALIFIMGFQLIMPILANVIMKPIESAINNHYINDAKRIISSNKDLIVIGITGSYGKTSVKFYLETLLKSKFNVLVTPESYNTPMGVVKTIRQSLLPTHEIFVCEMGARYVGDIKEICDIVNPKHAIICSIGPQHLETFGSIENVVSTKFELADAIPDDGMLFLNGQDDLIAKNIADHKDKYSNMVFYSAADAQSSKSGTSFTYTNEHGESQDYQMKLIGQHNVINVAGAICVANKLGCSLQSLVIPVRRIESVPHRLQLINRGAITIIDDAYNSNPVGSKSAVETLKTFDGMRILITPGMVELGEREDELNYKFGTYAADCADYILLVGGVRVKPIEKGALDSGFEKSKCLIFDSLQEAMKFANSIGSDLHKYILLENDLPDNY